MHRSTFLLVSLISLALTACTNVFSVMPVGDEPVYLEPIYWEGQWLAGWNDEPDDPEKETITVNVVDAAGGVLEISGLEGFGGKVHALITQHRYAGGKAQFINFQFINLPPEESPPGYVWGLFHRAGNALIIWWPVDAAFENLARKGEIAGKPLGDGDFLIELLSREKLDQISMDSGKSFFDYEHEGEGALESAVWFRTSAIPSPVVSQIATGPGAQLPAPEAKAVVNQTAAPQLSASIIELGEGGRSSRSVNQELWINNAGQILSPGWSPSVWHEGVWTKPPEVVSGVVEAMNNNGTLVGCGTEHEYQATLWDKSRGAIYLGKLESGAGSHAIAINDHDQVVGRSNVKRGDSWFVHAFLWEKGVMTGLDTPEGADSYANAINASGEVVGEMDFRDNWREYKAFFWKRGTGMTILGTLGGVSSAAHDINDAGDVVGSSETVQGYSHPFLWRQGGNMMDLGTLGGRNGSAEDINNAGQVVGWSEIKHGDRSDRRAFLWVKGQMIDLSQLPEVKAAGWISLIRASAINDLGQIVGIGIREDGQHSFLLTLQPRAVPSP
jgi:probable HAF family extracellular repeat protein